MQGCGGADLLAVVVIIWAAQAAQSGGAGGAVCCCMRRGRWGAGGAVCWRGDLAQVCRAAASSGRRVVPVCFWPSWSSSGRRRLSRAQAVRHHRAGRPRRARPGQKEKAQGGGAGCARVALGLCRRCWSAADPAGPRRGRFAVCRRGQILHFTG